MSKLFETGMIKNLKLPNRFVRSATYECLAADDGAVTPALKEFYATLARGGIGLIMTSHAFVRPEGQAGPRQLGAYKDDLIDGLGELADTVHHHGGRIALQIAHAGTYGFEKLTGKTPWAASEFEGLAKTPRRVMTADDIRAVTEAFAAAAGRARAAGFDGVQIHSAHGYLLSQFLSPHYNRRTDDYGGDSGKRARIHLEVYRAVREAVGDDFPVMIKMNSRDFVENGLELDDSVRAAKMLAAEGIDAIEISGGTVVGTKLSPSRVGIKSADKEAYFREEARAFRREIDIPLILVGGMRSFEVAEKFVDEGTADFISMSRPLIREPDLIGRWKSGDRSPAKCVSDNLCFTPFREIRGVHCVTAERELAQKGNAG